MHGQARSSLRRQRLLSRFWHCARGFWRGSSAWSSWGLVVLLVVSVLLGLTVQYRLNIWNRDFFNALGRKDGAALWDQALLFLPLVAVSAVIAVLGVWGRMTMQRRWRAWISTHLIDRWLQDDRPHWLDLMAGDHQNAEYRIAEDARVATEAPIDFAVGLLSSMLIALTFVDVLWRVGGNLALTVHGHALVLPGYLVLAAIAYAATTTATMLVIGRRLVRFVEEKNQAEAALRHAGARAREQALTGEDDAGRGALCAALGQVILCWRGLRGQTMRTAAIVHGNSLLAPVVGLILCAPKYLTGSMALGEVTQAAAAFVVVQAAFNWLIDNYARLADWTSSACRVGALLVALDGLEGALPRHHDPAAQRAARVEDGVAGAVLAEPV